MGYLEDFEIKTVDISEATYSFLGDTSETGGNIELSDRFVYLELKM